MSGVVVNLPEAQESCLSPVFLDEYFHTQAHLERCGELGATQQSKARALPWEDACSIQTDQSRNVN